MRWGTKFDRSALEFNYYIQSNAFALARAHETLETFFAKLFERLNG